MTGIAVLFRRSMQFDGNMVVNRSVFTIARIKLHWGPQTNFIIDPFAAHMLEN